MPNFSKLATSVYLYNTSHFGSFFSGEEVAGEPFSSTLTLNPTNGLPTLFSHDVHL